MAKKRKIYLLENLSPEVKAVTFAKCSRSPKSFKEIAAELTEEKSAKFHKKWVIGYGHSSVAEHAVLSLAFENISILASKVIEDNRLASYTEKSTRYQDFSVQKRKGNLTPYSYYCPPKIINSSFKEEYLYSLNNLFQTYEKLKDLLFDYLSNKLFPKKKVLEKENYRLIKSKVFDNIRYLLPLATLTNLGMTVNARSLEHAIRKMLSHPLEEVREIAQEMKKVSLKATPTLIKYAEPNDYLIKTRKALKNLSKNFLKHQPIRDKRESVVLVDYEENAQEKIISAILYRFSSLSFAQIMRKVKKMKQKEKEEVIDQTLKRMSDYDWPIRELEHTYYTFDILIDYGAFRDIQRHRICTQTSQDLTIEYGYEIPLLVKEAELKKIFISAIEKSEQLYRKIKKKFPLEAQYVLPLAFRKRLLITANLREFYHFIKLRSGKRGHYSYRQIAQKIWQEINKVHPLLAKYIKVDLSDYYQ